MVVDTDTFEKVSRFLANFTNRRINFVSYFNLSVLVLMLLDSSFHMSRPGAPGPRASPHERSVCKLQ